MRGGRIPQSLKEYVSSSENSLCLVNIKEVCRIVIFRFTSIWILFFFCSFLYFFLIECNYYLVLEFTFITCRGVTICNVTFTMLCFIIKVACRVKANMIRTTKNIVSSHYFSKKLKNSTLLLESTGFQFFAKIIGGNMKGKWNTWDGKYIICVFKI